MNTVVRQAINEIKETMPCPQCGGQLVVKNGPYGYFWCHNGNWKTNPCNFKMTYVKKAKIPRIEDVSLSKYQDPYIVEVKTGSRHICLTATAGSGKTFTCILSFQVVPTSWSVVFLAFGKEISTSNAEKCPPHVDNRTVNSLSLGNCLNFLFAPDNKAGRDNFLNNQKIQGIVLRVLEQNPTGSEEWDKEVKKNAGKVKKLVDFAKSQLFTPENVNFRELAAKFKVKFLTDNPDIEDLLFDACDYCFEESINDFSQGDFADTVYWCATGKIPCRKYDLVVIDECQDLSPDQIQFVINTVSEKGKIVMVGDRFQAIMAFRGASTHAIDDIIAKINPVVLPLSLSYRCPKATERWIKENMPHIPFEVLPDAPEGKMEDVQEDFFIQNVKVGDMVLCRNNAPLVAPAISLIKHGIKATIRGREIGAKLATETKDLIKKARKQSGSKGLQVSQFIKWLRDYRLIETDKLMERDMEDDVQELNDLCDVILAICEDSDIIWADEVPDRISSIFSDNSEGVVFSSCHKAKGLEAETVWIIHPELMPSKAAQDEDAMQQEQNLIFVARTRAKLNTYIVH